MTASSKVEPDGCLSGGDSVDTFGALRTQLAEIVLGLDNLPNPLAAAYVQMALDALPTQSPCEPQQSHIVSA